MKPIIDHQAKEKILAADLSNIVRKVKAGKPLTAAERSLIDGEAEKAHAAGTLTAAELSHITGLTDRRLRQLAAAGYLPKPNRGLYPAMRALEGFIRYQRELLGAKDDLYHVERGMLCQARRKAAERDNEIAEGRLYPKEAVNTAMVILAREQTAFLQRRLETEEPAKCIGLDFFQIQARMASVVDEFCQFRQRHEYWPRFPEEFDPDILKDPAILI